jgi:hypothetical protein
MTRSFNSFAFKTMRPGSHFLINQIKTSEKRQSGIFFVQFFGVPLKCQAEHRKSFFPPKFVILPKFLITLKNSNDVSKRSIKLIVAEDVLSPSSFLFFLQDVSEEILTA